MLSYKHNEYSFEDKKNKLFLNVLAKCCSYIIMDYVNNTSKLSVFLLCARMCSYSVIFETATHIYVYKQWKLKLFSIIPGRIKVFKLCGKSLDTINI